MTQHNAFQHESSLTNWLATIGLCIIIFTLLVAGQSNINLSDTVWATHVAASIMHDGDIDLSEYATEIEQLNYYAVRPSNDQLVSFFPLGTPLLATPILFVLEQVLPDLNDQTIHAYLLNHPHDSPLNLKLHLYTASVIITLTAAAFFQLTRYYLAVIPAGLLTLIFVFGTSAYSLASRALWQHGPSMLMLTLTLWLIVRGERIQKGIWLAGFTLGCAYLIRPSNSIPILIFSGYILLFHANQFWKFICASLPIAALFFYVNFNTFGTLFHPYYLSSQLQFSSTVWIALAGNLLSPARGLFIFSPFLLFVPLLVFKRWSESQLKPFDLTLLLIVGLHWLVISLFPHWYGGDSFGPRFFSDMLPLILLLLVRHLSKDEPMEGKKAVTHPARWLFASLALFSIIIHHTGAAQKRTWAWNYQPILLDLNSSRLWSWSDSQLFSAFSGDQTGLAVVESSGDNSVVTLQLSNMSESPQMWEFIYPANLLSSPTSISTAITSNRENFLALRLVQAVPPYQIVHLSLEANATASTNNQMIQVNVYEKHFDGPLVDSKTVPLDLLLTSEGGHIFQPTADLPDFKPYFGSGWYDLESFGDFSWRWAQSPSILYFNAPRNQSVTLNLVFGELFNPAVATGKGHSGEVIMTVNQTQVAPIVVTMGQPISIPLEAKRGLNTVRFELATGNFVPNQLDANNGDLRPLSFIINELSVTAE